MKTREYYKFKSFFSFLNIDKKKIDTIYVISKNWNDICDEQYSELIKPFKIKSHLKERTLVLITQCENTYKNFKYIKNELLNEVNSFLSSEEKLNKCIIKLL